MNDDSMEWKAQVNLPADAVDHIVASVKEGGGRRSLIPEDLDRQALSRDLGRAQIVYRFLIADDQELTAKQKLKRLQNLRAALLRLQLRFAEFTKEGEPGWQLLEMAADERLRHVTATYAEIEAERVQLQNQRRNGLWSTDDQQRLRALDRLRDQSDQEIIAFDATPLGIFRQTIRGVDSLLTWIKIALEPVEQAEQLPRVLVADREESGHVSALRWLITDEVPGIYTRHFRRKVGWSISPTTGQIGGPAVRFTMSVLACFGISSLKTSEPLSEEAIVSYWRSNRARQASSEE